MWNTSKEEFEQVGDVTQSWLIGHLDEYEAQIFRKPNWNGSGKDLVIQSCSFRADTPDFVHIVMDGKVVKSGDKDLAKKIEEVGYDWLKKEKS